MNKGGVLNLRIEYASESSLDLLRPLWLCLHRHHQTIAPNLRPYVDDDASWTARRAELETLVVTPELRGQGIGALLLDRVESELDRLGIKDMIVGALPTNTDVLDLYRRRGFEPTWLVMTRFASRGKGDGPQHSSDATRPER